VSRPAREWLTREIPQWVREGLVTPEAAAALVRRYGPDTAGQPRNLALAVISVFGSLLVGLGVILLLAHNWADLPRAARLGIAFLPLLAAQGLAAFAVLRGRDSLAWREGVGTGWMLAVGACIALVAQVYHIPGDAGVFTLTWMLLSIPIVYLLRAALPAAGVLAGLVFWAGHEQAFAGTAVAFWPLAALLAPFLRTQLRDEPASARTALLAWAVALAVLAALGITLERVTPGLWIVVYAGALALMSMTGESMPFLSGFWRRPFASAGAVGTVILGLMLTCEWPWEEIGWRHLRHGGGHIPAAAVFDYAVAVALPLAAVARWGLSLVRRAGVVPLAFGAAAVLATASFAIVGASPAAEGVVRVLYNLFVAVLGGVLAARGILDRRLGEMNAGLLAIAVLVMLRFLDQDVSFVVRGLVFVGLGVALLAANAVLARRMRGENAP
jgi:hypothetical protein